MRSNPWRKWVNALHRHALRAGRCGQPIRNNGYRAVLHLRCICAICADSTAQSQFPPRLFGSKLAPIRKSGNRHERRKQGRGRRILRLERSVPDRGPADRGRAHDPRRGGKLCRRQARAAHRGGLSRGKDRSGDLPRDGRGGPARHHHPGRIWRAWRRLCDLRAGRARSRARRLRLPLDDDRAVVAGDVSDPRLRLGGAAQEVPAEARQRRMDRLLRPDRARRRLRSGRHEDAGREDGGRLPADRLQDVDFQRADRRRVRGLGEVGGA